MQSIYVFIVVTILSIYESSAFNLSASELTPEWIIHADNSSSSPPLITNINGELLHVFFPASNQTSVVRLESSRSSCEFQLSARENVYYVLGATALENGTLVVVLMEKGDNDTEYVVKAYTIKDHHTCSKPTVDALVLKRGVSGGRETVFGYQNTFDLILKNENLCDPDHLCKISYDSDGHHLNDSGATEFTSPSRDWGIDVADKNSPSSGFFYNELTKDHKYLILKFDSNLKVVGTRRWDRMVSYSAAQGRVTVCEKIYKAIIKCTLLDSNLTDVATAVIPMDENVETTGPWEVFNTPDGGAIFYYAIRNNRSLQYEKISSTISTYIRIIGSDGTVGKLIKIFDHKICDNNKVDVVEMDNGLCFRLLCSNETLLRVKCIVENKDQFMNEEGL